MNVLFALVWAVELLTRRGGLIAVFLGLAILALCCEGGFLAYAAMRHDDIITATIR